MPWGPANGLKHAFPENMSKNYAYTKVITLASNEAQSWLLAPFTRYSDTSKGYDQAVQFHRDLMDFELGSDEHPDVQQALVDRRWEFADFCQKLHGWDVQC